MRVKSNAPKGRPALYRGCPRNLGPQHLPKSAARTLLICALVGLPLAGHAQTASGRGPQDFDQTTLNPLGTIFSSAIITNALAGSAFTPANDWNFTFAGALNATSISVAADLSNPLYTPWVINSPNVTGLDNVVRNRGVVNQDAGGSVYQLKYLPGATDPANIHFIQAYSESFNGGPVTYAVDNGGAATPWYDTSGVSGIQTLANGANPNGSWMQDTPYDIAPVGQSFSSNLTFNVMIAVDTVNGGVNNVTIYSGQSWGHLYTATFAPEPSSLLLLGATVLPMVGGVLARKRRVTAA